MHGDDNHINFSYNARSTNYVSFSCPHYAILEGFRRFGQVTVLLHDKKTLT